MCQEAKHKSQRWQTEKRDKRQTNVHTCLQILSFELPACKSKLLFPKILLWIIISPACTHGKSIKDSDQKEDQWLEQQCSTNNLQVLKRLSNEKRSCKSTNEMEATVSQRQLLNMHASFSRSIIILTRLFCTLVNT